MTPATAEILSQGDEVITGQITDTNSAWLSQRLFLLGFEISRHTTVGDRLGALAGSLREIAYRSDVCICTGGLGPTVDDLTAEAVSLAFGRPLQLDAEALRQIESYFSDRGLRMPAVNRKQAMLPAGADRIDNRWGTAPGFSLRHERCYFSFLPGVPTEMRDMFEETVEPSLIEGFRLDPVRLVVLRTIGLGESSLQERLQPLELPDSVRLGFRAGIPENEVKLLFPPDFPPAEINRLVDRALSLLGQSVFSIDGLGGPGGSLAAAVGRLLANRGATLATAESFSSGQLAWLCRGQSSLVQSLVTADASRLFRSMDLQYPVDPKDLKDASRSFAGRLREREGTDYALVNLGPPLSEHLSADCAPNLVTAALAGPGGTISRAFSVAGASERRQIHAAALTLDLLRRRLDRHD